MWKMVASNASHEMSLTAGSGAPAAEARDELAAAAGTSVGVGRGRAVGAALAAGGAPVRVDDQMSATAPPNTTSSATTRTAAVGKPDRCLGAATIPGSPRFERRIPGRTGGDSGCRGLAALATGRPQPGQAAA